MASPLSKNVAAAVGLVPTVLGGVKRLPGKAVALPVMAIGSALAGLDAARREYDDLAARGEQLIARLRGTSFDEVEDATASVEAVQERLPVAEPVRSSTARVDSAAAPEVVEQVDKIAQNVGAPLITDHSQLPLPDYDHMTLGSLRGRLRSLDLQQLVQLRDYEKSKADRLPVVTMLDHRIAKLANDESTPSGTTEAAEPLTATKPPKKVSATAAAAAAPTPTKTKVRIT